MLTFEFLNARHGDCFLVRWSERVMLVDGGPTGVYDSTLRARLLDIPRASPEQPPTVDILCVTHVDEDHIAGVVRLLIEVDRALRDQLPAPLRIGRVWHNSTESLLETVTPGLAASAATIMPVQHAAVAASYAQGEEVRRLVSRLGLAGNSPFHGPILCGTSTSLDGLGVTVIAPDRSGLETLAEKWNAAISSRDPSAIAAAYADRSVPNLSSIALHLRLGGCTALLAGDARGDHVIAGLLASGLLREAGRLDVDLLKLPHHGSANNAAPSFFERIHAANYVISADGVKHHHPDETTLRWLVESRGPNEEYTIHMTNPIPFAVDALRELRRNRRFKVNLRTADARSVVIPLPAA